MEMILEILTPFLSELVIDIILPIILQLLGIAILFVGTIAIRWWKNLQLEWWVKELIEDGVLYAQETFRDQVGELKYLEAVAYIVSMLDDKGIKITEEDLRAKIQATVKRLKSELGEFWYQDPEKPQE